jgi:hypothetical protein
MTQALLSCSDAHAAASTATGASLHIHCHCCLRRRGRRAAGWMMRDEVQRLVLVIAGVDSGETLERWVFNVQAERPAVLKESG